ncbi:MAG: tRNA (adenosine(37)-N6)-threonylcarbamoyltransferase complex transferase subunit TsaD, partial [Desulfuromonadaceae bacterium]
GVACNSGLRAEMARLCQKQGKTLFFPSPVYCADNAAMLAVAGDHYLTDGRRDSLDLNALASWPLDRSGNLL